MGGQFDAKMDTTGGSVDFDLQLALDLALFEKEIGIKSTYFILTTCESYNVLAEKNKEILKKIISLGHEIGLHFDPTLYKNNLEDTWKCKYITSSSDYDGIVNVIIKGIGPNGKPFSINN